MKTGLQPGVVHYFKVAHYDSFGKTQLNVTPTSFAVTPLSGGGVRSVDELPVGPPNEGEEVVYLQTDKKLYRWDGEAWTKSVTAADIAGQVVAAQIANSAIDSTKLAANSVTDASLAAGAVKTQKLAVRKHLIY